MPRTVTPQRAPPGIATPRAAGGRTSPPAPASGRLEPGQALPGLRGPPAESPQAARGSGSKLRTKGARVGREQQMAGSPHPPTHPTPIGVHSRKRAASATGSTEVAGTLCKPAAETTGGAAGPGRATGGVIGRLFAGVRIPPRFVPNVVRNDTAEKKISPPKPLKHIAVLGAKGLDFGKFGHGKLSACKAATRSNIFATCSAGGHFGRGEKRTTLSREKKCR